MLNFRTVNVWSTCTIQSSGSLVQTTKKSLVFEASDKKKYVILDYKENLKETYNCMIKQMMSRLQTKEQGRVIAFRKRGKSSYDHVVAKEFRFGGGDKKHHFLSHFQQAFILMTKNVIFLASNVDK